MRRTATAITPETIQGDEGGEAETPAHARKKSVVQLRARESVTFWPSNESIEHLGKPKTCNTRHFPEHQRNYSSSTIFSAILTPEVRFLTILWINWAVHKPWNVYVMQTWISTFVACSYFFPNYVFIVSDRWDTIAFTIPTLWIRRRNCRDSRGSKHNDRSIVFLKDSNKIIQGI